MRVPSTSEPAMTHDPPSALPPHKVRKLRKGTHSCQQCRRRKDRCVFDLADSRTCSGCKARGLDCRPQTASTTWIDKRHGSSSSTNPSTPHAVGDNLADRLSRLEQLISDMASSSTPVTAGYSGSALLSSSSPRTAETSTHEEASTSSLQDDTWGSPASDSDMLYPSIAHNARAVTLSGNGMLPFGATSMFSPSTADIVSSSPAHNPISAQLYVLLPPEPTCSILISNGPSMFLGPQGSDQQISPTDHPAVIAKRLMMLALCLQQLPSSFDTSVLTLRGNRSTEPGEVGVTIRTWVDTVAALVTSSDVLISNLEGIETLILQAIVQGDSGHLRKSWMIGRKAISLGMLLGIHHDQPSPGTYITSCAPGQAVQPETIESLWFRANCIDRYSSLVLGLPPTVADSSFASEKRDRGTTPMDRLSKAYGVCAGGISERNKKLAAGQDAQALTRSIEHELESVIHLMDTAWWLAPDLSRTSEALPDELMVMNLQVRHHILTVLLHLPYMLQPNESLPSLGLQEHSRSACMHACRAVVHRFLRFRRLCKNIITGRQIDYAALLSCMSLLQGHIVRYQHPMGFSLDGDGNLQAEDVSLVDSARQTMQDIAVCNSGDGLSSEAAHSLQELLVYIQACSDARNIFCSSGPPAEGFDGQGSHHQGTDGTSGPYDFSSVDPSLVFPVQSF